MKKKIYMSSSVTYDGFGEARYTLRSFQSCNRNDVTALVVPSVVRVMQMATSTHCATMMYRTVVCC